MGLRLLGSALSACMLIAVTSPARADLWTALYIHGGDNRLFTGDGDWMVNSFKGECGGNRPVIIGVSQNYHMTWGGFVNGWYADYAFVHDILCGSFAFSVDTSVGYTLGGRFDDRRDLSWGDWAPGLGKMECAASDVMTGLAQWGSDAALTNAARCSHIVGARGARDCSVMNFHNVDARETTSRGEWDPGYFKGECGVGRYVKGVAHGTDFINMVVEADTILCCSPQF